jgi:hypothetical protein
MGRVISTHHSSQVDVSSFLSGIYFVRFNSSSGVIMKKFVKY